MSSETKVVYRLADYNILTINYKPAATTGDKLYGWVWSLEREVRGEKPKVTAAQVEEFIEALGNHGENEHIQEAATKLWLLLKYSHAQLSIETKGGKTYSVVISTRSGCSLPDIYMSQILIQLTKLIRRAKTTSRA